MSTWSIGIVTAPRAKFFLAGTITGLRQGGWQHEDITVYAEPRSPVVRQPAVTISVNKGLLGETGNWWQALQGVASKTADYYAVFHDDVVVRPGVRSLIEASAVLPAAVYSLFTPANIAAVAGDDEYGWFEPRVGVMFKTAQALVITKHMLPILLERFDHAASISLGIGASLSLLCHELYLPFMCYRPSLAQHTADAVSSTGRETDEYTRMAYDYVDTAIRVEQHG